MKKELIKELRNRTGAGFLNCKKALEFSQNDLEKAIIWLQKQGTIKAAKKSVAIAAEGIVQTASDDSHTVIFELNSQTDFVANNKEFKNLANKISKTLLKNDFKTIKDALTLKINDQTINDLITATTIKTGEKIVLRRAKRIFNNDKVIGSYTHFNKRIAAIVIAEGGDIEAVTNVAMHVASMNPQFLDESNIPKLVLDNIKEEIENSEIIKNKTDSIREKITKGMLSKQLSELTLVDQEFVMKKMSVGAYLNENGSKKVLEMIRYELGEGIETQKTNFATEVSNQMKV